MTITRITKLNGDSAADCQWSEVERFSRDLAYFAGIVGNGKLIQSECAEITALCQHIRDKNQLHRHRYNPVADDEIMGFVDELDSIVRDKRFTPSVGHAFLIEMQRCVAGMRQAVGIRMTTCQDEMSQAAAPTRRTGTHV